MTKKNLYYRSVLRRRNVIKESLFALFFSICSFPRLLIEVFTRKSFGERYFSTAHVMTLSVLMLLSPIIIYAFAVRFGSGNSDNYLLKHQITWYIFTVIFIFFARKRSQEIAREPSVFDFAKFSLSTGLFQLWYIRLFPLAWKKDIRRYETFYEPLPFILLGLFLFALGQSIGLMLAIAGTCYGISYAAAYYQGDHFIMDLIDEQILNEEMEHVFVDDEDPSEARGFRFLADKPRDPNLRRKLMDSFFEEEYVPEVR